MKLRKILALKNWNIEKLKEINEASKVFETLKTKFQDEQDMAKKTQLLPYLEIEAKKMGITIEPELFYFSKCLNCENKNCSRKKQLEPC